MVDIPIELLFVVIFAGVFAFIVYRLVRGRGFKGAMFGARIDRTVGEVNCEKQGPMGMSLKIHVLRREGAGKLVGIEVVAKAFGSYEMTPLRLSTYEAQRLASFLSEAIRAP